MSTQIQTASKPQVGYRGFKYNIVYYYGYFPGTVPATGQIVVLFYDDGEGGAAFGGISINHFNADGAYIGEVVQKIANQNVTITNASEKYNVINGTFTNFASYSRIDSVTAWGNIDPSGIGGSTNVVYADFGTSNTGTVSSVSAINLTSSGTNLTSTVTNNTTTPVITLNVPNASAANRGVLTTTDWSEFNNKQAALVSGTNIKTINGTSVLGSGNLVISSGPTVYTSNGGTVITGPVGQTISNSLLIPANTLSSPNAVIEIEVKSISMVRNSGNIPGIYTNTSNSLTGATLLGYLGDLSVANHALWRRTFNIRSGILYTMTTGLSLQTDYFSGYDYATLSFTTNVNRYFLFAVSASSATQVFNASYKVTIY